MKNEKRFHCLLSTEQEALKLLGAAHLARSSTPSEPQYQQTFKNDATETAVCTSRAPVSVASFLNVPRTFVYIWKNKSLTIMQAILDGMGIKMKWLVPRCDHPDIKKVLNTSTRAGIFVYGGSVSV